MGYIQVFVELDGYKAVRLCHGSLDEKTVMSLSAAYQVMVKRLNRLVQERMWMWICTLIVVTLRPGMCWSTRISDLLPTPRFSAAALEAYLITKKIVLI
jgi:hypothetical protein